jgi:hypothetical protein
LVRPKSVEVESSGEVSDSFEVCRDVRQPLSWVLRRHEQRRAECWRVAAILAAAADGQVPGVSAASIGGSLFVDLDGTMREGPMVVPVVTGMAAGRIANALRDIRVSRLPPSKLIEPASDSPHVDADDLLAHFIAQAIEGDPHVCTYRWAYRVLFNAPCVKFSMAYAQKAIQLACRTHPRELPGLGLVRLDTFIVSKKGRFPSDGYWPVAHHDREEWGRVLGNAAILD